MNGYMDRCTGNWAFAMIVQIDLFLYIMYNKHNGISDSGNL
jgi:hypothetical protein